MKQLKVLTDKLVLKNLFQLIDQILITLQIRVDLKYKSEKI